MARVNCDTNKGAGSDHGRVHEEARGEKLHTRKAPTQELHGGKVPTELPAGHKPKMHGGPRQRPSREGFEMAQTTGRKKLASGKSVERASQLGTPVDAVALLSTIPTGAAAEKIEEASVILSRLANAARAASAHPSERWRVAEQQALRTELVAALRGLPEFREASARSLAAVIDKLQDECQQARFMGSAELLSREICRRRLRALGLNPEARPPSFAELARAAGVPAIFTQVRLSDLPEILRDGALFPPCLGQNSSWNNGDDHYVYASAWTTPQETLAKARRAASGVSLKQLAVTRGVVAQGARIVFLPDVLDQVSWSHANINWDYGSTGPDSYYPNLTFIHFLAGIRWEGEILFDKAIELAQQREFVIVVRTPEEKKTVLQQLPASIAKDLDLENRIVCLR